MTEDAPKLKPDIKNKSRGGLSPKHHGELNISEIVYPGGKTAKDAKILELRELYANDPVALQQIDSYDGSSEYYKKILEYRDAIESGDTVRRAELENWFKNKLS